MKKPINMQIQGKGKVAAQNGQPAGLAIQFIGDGNAKLQIVIPPDEEADFPFSGQYEITITPKVAAPVPPPEAN